MRTLMIFPALFLVVQGYQPLSSRRDALSHVVGSAAAFATGASVFTPAPAQAVLSSKGCASGVGEGCDDLAQGNSFIKSLQEKSAANREQNAKEARDAYYMKNYPDFFATVGKSLVKKTDGSFMTVSDEELMQLKKENKVTIEIPKAKGGKYSDVTQKPILVLRE